jgi:hypothetical protein
LATALKALQARERSRSDNAWDGPDDLASEIEHALTEVEQGLDRLRAIPEVEERRRLVRTRGFHIPLGPLDQAMERAAAGLPDYKRTLLAIVRDRVVGAYVAEFLALVEWRAPA